MESNIIKMDFETMHANCIEIHQQCYELYYAAKKYNVYIDIILYDDLSTNTETKSWDGMGRYAKKLLDSKQMWDLLPETISFRTELAAYNWNKKEAQQRLKDAFQELGGQKLYDL